MEAEHSAAIAVLTAFFNEMRSWQLRCKQRLDEERRGTLKHDDSVRIALEELKAVYDKYCKYKKLPDNITFSYTPSYDPEGEKILEVLTEGKRLHVTTERTTARPVRKIRYTLHKLDEGYKISDKVERYNEHQKKFVPWDLLL